MFSVLLILHYGIYFSHTDLEKKFKNKKTMLILLMMGTILLFGLASVLLTYFANKNDKESLKITAFVFDIVQFIAGIFISIFIFYRIYS